jgi:hypothetical protein
MLAPPHPPGIHPSVICLTAWIRDCVSCVVEHPTHSELATFPPASQYIRTFVFASVLS